MNVDEKDFRVLARVVYVAAIMIVVQMGLSSYTLYKAVLNQKGIAAVQHKIDNVIEFTGKMFVEIRNLKK